MSSGMYFYKDLWDVFLSQVNVVGFAHFWDTSINVVSTINLVLCIGLAVDYAAHIGHAFMVASGSRKSKAIMMQPTYFCICLKNQWTIHSLKKFPDNLQRKRTKNYSEHYYNRDEIGFENFEKKIIPTK